MFVINTQEVRDELESIDFKPMVAPLDVGDSREFKYYSNVPVLKSFPQGVLFLIKKARIYLFLSFFLFPILDYVLKTFFYNYFMSNHVAVIALPWLLFSAAMFFAKVETNGGEIREYNFKKHNSKRIMWSAEPLDSAQQKLLAFKDLAFVLTKQRKNVSINNVLGFLNSGIHTGDMRFVKKTTRMNSETYSQEYQAYSVANVDSSLIGMKIFRKRLDWTGLVGSKSINLPESIGSSLIIYPMSRRNRRSLTDFFKTEDFGEALVKLFEKYPDLIKVQIFGDELILTWLTPIAGNFDSIKGSSDKPVEQYRFRINGTLDLLDSVAKYVK